MSFQEILGIASVVMLLFWILYGVYQRAKGNAFGMIAEFIAYAENTGLAGPEKMAMVVDNLYEIIPAPFKLILTRERLREAAQNVYEWMKAYALEYIKKKSGEAAENIQESDAAAGEDAQEDEYDPQIFMEETDIVPEIAGEDSPGI